MLFSFFTRSFGYADTFSVHSGKNLSKKGGALPLREP